MNEYPVEWDGRTYALHDLTVGAKAAFCKWAVRWNGMQQMEVWGDMPHILNPLLASIPALTWWGDGGMSKLVADTLDHPDGDLRFNRLLFGESAKALSDSDLRTMIDAKAKEQTAANNKALAAGFRPGPDGKFPPVNDYFLAIAAIREESDPKALRTGTAPTGVTGTTAT